MTSPIKFFNEVAEIDDLLDHYLDMTPEQVMTESIRDRLKYTLEMYQTELEDATDFCRPFLRPGFIGPWRRDKRNNINVWSPL